MKFDLHVHSNYSDGKYSPEIVVEKAFNERLDGIAITDHDTVDGIEEAIRQSKKYNNFYVIPGIEFGCIHNDEEVHILGYFIDYKNIEIINITNELKASRFERSKKIVKKLNKLGININIKDVLDFSDENNIGRPHIARAMMKLKYVKSIEEAFNLFLNRGKPAYIERLHLSIEDTIKLIHLSGGLAVLAHPGLLNDKSIVNYTISKGIDGLECIHSKHTELDREYFSRIASYNNLIITGGSDYHGDLEILGKFTVDIEKIPIMKERILNV